AEMQLLYHTQFGPPFLEAGSRLLAPVREVAPLTPRAAEGMDTFDAYGPPTPGFAEQVYVYDLIGDSRGTTMALLQSAGAERAVCLRWPVASLPCFTAWKSTMALEEGYVTGLEPATGYPNSRSFERSKGRVELLPPGGSWSARWTVEVADNSDAVL